MMKLLSASTAEVIEMFFRTACSFGLMSLTVKKCCSGTSPVLTHANEVNTRYVRVEAWMEVAMVNCPCISGAGEGARASVADRARACGSIWSGDVEKL